MHDGEAVNVLAHVTSESIDGLP